MKISPPRLLLFLGFAASLTLSACGPSSPTTTVKPTTSTTPVATAPAEVPAATTTTTTTKSAPTTPAMPTNQPAAQPAQPTTALATFGAGCFWGVEHIFKDIPGVLDAVSGYSGGHTKNPTYQQICEGDTGHIEVVQLTYDPAKVSFDTLADVFFRLHDPTQVNGQGPDIGYQYRSVIFYHDDAQKAAAERIKTARAPKYKRPIATTIEAAETFYKAEDYHQDYYVKTGKTPYCHYLRPE